MGVTKYHAGINNVISNIYMQNKPVEQVGPENPKGHAVHKFSSLISQPVHVPPQAEKYLHCVSNKIANIYTYYICYIITYLLSR